MKGIRNQGGSGWRRALRASAVVVLAMSLLGPAVAEAKGKKRKGPAKKKGRADPAVIEAKKFFNEAQRLYDLGKFDDALRAYEAAYDAKPMPAFLFNIAQCHRNLGADERAIFFFKRYLELSPEVENRANVEASIEVLEKKIEKEAIEAERAAADARRREELRRLEALGDSGGIGPVVPMALGVSTDGKPRKKKPVVARWWFWTVVGVAVAAGGGIGTYFLVTSMGPGFDDVVDHR